MKHPLDRELFLAMLNDSKGLGVLPTSKRYELIGNIDPMDPNLSEADKLIVMRACKKSPPFFLWVLKQANESPADVAVDTVWGSVSTIVMLGTAFASVVYSTIETAYPTLRGKRMDIKAWYFESGALCISAVTKSKHKHFTHVVRTAPVVIERNGATLVPAGIPAQHLAGLFSLGWTPNEK